MGLRLPVHERFHSWQGEGTHMGRAAFFVRLFGCPIHCPWCDSAGTWHPDHVPSYIEKMDVEAIAREAADSGARFCVVTGGEPCIHDLSPLTEALRAAGVACHLETSGAFEISGSFDWITLSPKWRRLPLESAMEAASEFKLIVEEGDSIRRWATLLGDRFGSRSVWLHPEWSQRDNAAVLESITNWVKERGDPYRAGLQAHKMYRADALDTRSRKNVPLGGNEELGF